jgi:hypothetical protein
MDKRFDRIELLLDRLYEKLDSKVDKWKKPKKGLCRC